MGVGAGLYVYVVVVQKFTFAISSPDEFLSFAVNVNEQRIIAFLTEKCCYLNLRSKVRTQLR